MKILIQHEGEKPRLLEEGYAKEFELQTFLLEHAELMPLDEIAQDTPPLLCIGFEVRTSDGSQDLLYVDKSGMLTIVETKLKRKNEVRREVVGQILEYAADTSMWSVSDLEDRANRFFNGPHCPEDQRGFTLSQAVESFLIRTNDLAPGTFDYQGFVDSVLANIERGHIRLVIAVDEPPSPLLRTVEFVNRFSQRFEMYLFQLTRFHDRATASNIFVPTIFGRVGKVGSATRQKWSQDKFTEDLSSSNPDPIVQRCLRIYEHFKLTTDEELWGSGGTTGSYALYFKHGSRRVPVARIDSKSEAMDAVRGLGGQRVRRCSAEFGCPSQDDSGGGQRRGKVPQHQHGQYTR